MKNIIKLIVVFLVITSNTFAGGWTQKKGSSFYKLDFRYLPGKSVYNDDGEKVNFTIEDLSFGFYAEYGVTDALTVTTDWVTFHSTNIEESISYPSLDDVSGISDASIGLRYLILNFGNSVISAAGKINIPAGKTYEDGKLWLGTGEWNQTIGLEFGHSFYPVRAYASATFYYRNRTEGFSDDIKWEMEGGYSFNEVLSVIAKFHGLNTLENGDANFKGGFAIYSNNQKYIAYGLDLNYKLSSRISFKLGYESGGAGRNIISAPVFSTGIFFSN
jgi:hypothetical protein